MSSSQTQATSANIVLTAALQQAASQTILECLNIAESAFPGLADGTGSAHDIEVIRQEATGVRRYGRLALHRLALGMGSLTWNSGRDYLRAVAHDLIRSNPPSAWSTTSLVRGALEAEAGFAYLFRPEPKRNKRLARTAAMLLTDAQYVSQQAKSLGETTVVETRRTRRGLERICSHAGAQVITDEKNSERRVALDGVSVGYEMNIAETIRTFWPPNAGHPYTLLSGASHSRPWILSASHLTGPTVINVLITSGLVMSTWLELAGQYVGVELTDHSHNISGLVAGTLTQALDGKYA
jgi:hypothetical protein